MKEVSYPVITYVIAAIQQKEHVTEKPKRPCPEDGFFFFQTNVTSPLVQSELRIHQRCGI